MGIEIEYPPDTLVWRILYIVTPAPSIGYIGISRGRQILGAPILWNRTDGLRVNDKSKSKSKKKYNREIRHNY